MTTEILGLKEITVNQGKKFLTHNDALRQLEGRLIHAIDRDVGTTPATPAEGDVYIVDQLGGLWSPATVDDIAHFFGGIWVFYTPVEGVRLWIDDEDVVVLYDGANWIIITKKKRSIVLYAKDMISAVTNGTTILKLEATTNLNGRDTHVFINANDTFALFDWIPPPEYDSGTVSYRYFWTTPGLDTDGVAMALEGVSTGDGDPLDVDHGTPVVLVDNIQSAADDTLISGESTAVTIAGTPIPGELINFRLFRDVSDGGNTATEDARVIALELFYNVG